MRKFLRVSTNIVIYFFQILCVIVVLLSIFGIKNYTVPTGSMEPNIHAGSLVAVDERADYSDIEVGDIIVYNRKYDDKRIIHRVIRIEEKGIFTKGDANSVEDGICITPDIFVGRYLCGIPHAGKVLDKLMTIQGKIAFASFVAIICIVNMICERKKK